MVICIFMGSVFQAAVGGDLLSSKEVVLKYITKSSNVLSAKGITFEREVEKRCHDVGYGSVKKLQVGSYEKVFSCRLPEGEMKFGFYFDHSQNNLLIDRFLMITNVADYNVILKNLTIENRKPGHKDYTADYQSVSWTLNKKNGDQISTDLSKYFRENVTIYQVGVASGGE